MLCLDCGMDEETRRICEAMAREYDIIELCLSAARSRRNSGRPQFAKAAALYYTEKRIAACAAKRPHRRFGKRQRGPFHSGEKGR